jgi:hypothetical protein
MKEWEQSLAQTILKGGIRVVENPYFAEAGAPKIEQENNDKAEQSGSYPQGKNDENVHVESEEIGLKNGDVSLY